MLGRYIRDRHGMMSLTCFFKNRGFGSLSRVPATHARGRVSGWVRHCHLQVWVCGHSLTWRRPRSALTRALTTWLGSLKSPCQLGPESLARLPCGVAGTCLRCHWRSETQCQSVAGSSVSRHNSGLKLRVHLVQFSTKSISNMNLGWRRVSPCTGHLELSGSWPH